MMYILLLALIIYFVFIRIMTIYSWIVSSAVLFRVKTKENAVHLTIDDVPYSPSSILEILNILREKNVSATLFITGQHLKSTTQEVVDALKSAIEDGVVNLGNHGMTDKKHAKLPLGELRWEIDEWETTVRRILGDKGITSYYRPASGIITRSIIDEARKRSLTVTLGDVYTFDLSIPWDFLHVATLCFTVSSGSIVIIHDREKSVKRIRDTIRGWKYLAWKVKKLP